MGSEDELIRQAQAGDVDSFCLLAQAYERRVYSLALHYCRDREDAEDLSQDVWLKAYAAITTFRNEATFYTWLQKIMINCFLNYRRSWYFRWHSRTTDLAEQETGSESGPNTFALERDLHNRLVLEKVMRALADVTPQQRLIFLLKHHEGMTYEEISRTLGCSVGTAKKSVSRTVTKLRQRLGVYEEPPAYLSCAAGEY